MAKSKEKMEALVPVEEQPYPVPANWRWVRLLYSFDNLTDSKKKIQQKDYLQEGNIPIIDQGKDVIGGYTNDEKMAYTEKLPVIIFGDHTRNVKYIDFIFAQGADGVKVLRAKDFLLPLAFYYSMLNLNIPNMGYRRHFPFLKICLLRLHRLLNNSVLLTTLEVCLLNWTKQKRKPRLWWMGMRIGKLRFCIRRLREN